MAQQIPCDLCEQVAADFVISIPAVAEVMGVCVSCLPAFTEQVVSAQDRSAADQSTDPGSVRALDLDPPDTTVIGPSDGPDTAQEASGMSDEEWEESGRSGAPAGQNGAENTVHDDQEEDPETVAAAHVPE